MKPLLHSVLASAFLLPAWAGTPVSESVREITGSGDFNADGFPDVLIVDKPTGLYRIGYGAEGGALTFASSRPTGTAPVESAAIGKLNGSADSFAVTASALNRIHVLSPVTTGSITPRTVSLAGIAPAALSALDLPAGAGPTTEDDLTVFSTLDPANGVQFRQIRSSAGTWAGLRTDDVSNALPLLANPLTPVAASAQQVGVLRDAGASLTFEMLEATGAALTTRVSVAALPPGTQWTSGIFQSPRADLFFYVPGQPTVTVRRLIPGAGGTYTTGPASTLTLPENVEQMLPVNDISGLRMAVRFANGGVSIFQYTEAGGFASPAKLTTSGAAGVLSGLVGMPGQSLQMLFAGSAGQASNQALTFSRLTGGWTQTGNTVIAAPDVFDSFANAFLLSAPLFRGDPSELTQVYHAGDWTTGLTVGASPFAVTAQVAEFGSSTSGLGAPVSLVVDNATAAPGGTAPNQLHPQFSVFAWQTTLGPVVDDIAISPAPGHYATAQQITWSGLAPGTNVYWRSGTSGAFSVAPTAGGPWLFRDAQIQYYALAGGVAGPVRTAGFSFSVPPALQDADGDGVPDFLELARGLDPAAGPDSDKDGVTDAEEIRQGTDPNSAASLPVGPAPALEEAIADGRVRLETITGSLLVHASAGTGLSFKLAGRDPAGMLTVGSGGAAANFGRGMLQGVVPSAEFLSVETNEYFGVPAPTLKGRQMLGVLPAMEPEAWSYPGTIPGEKTVQTAWSWGGVNWAPGSLLRPRGDVDTALTFTAPSGRELTSPLWGSTGTGNFSASDWTTLYQASVSSNPQPYFSFSLTPATTVEALIFHEVLVTLLNTRRAPGDQLPLGARDATGFDPAELQALRTADPAFPTQSAYRIRSVLTHVNAQVNGAATGSAALRKVARAVYLKHQTLAPDNAGDLPTPVSALRQWLRTGSLPAEYLSGFEATATEISSALTRVNTCRLTVPARPVGNYSDMIAHARTDGSMVAASSAGGTEVVLQSPEGSAAATELGRLFADTTLAALRFNFAAYTDLPSIGGLAAVEVISLEADGFPEPVGLDSDGDLLADGWEMLHFGSLIYNGSDRRDGSSYTLAQEYFEGTDPTRSTSAPASAPAAMELTQLVMARIAPGIYRLSVRWPAAYRHLVDIGFSSSDLLEDFEEMPNNADSDATGLFTADFNATEFSRRFFRPFVRLRR